MWHVVRTEFYKNRLLFSSPVQKVSFPLYLITKTMIDLLIDSNGMSTRVFLFKHGPTECNSYLNIATWPINGPLTVLLFRIRMGRIVMAINEYSIHTITPEPPPPDAVSCHAQRAEHCFLLSLCSKVVTHFNTDLTSYCLTLISWQEILL